MIRYWLIVLTLVSFLGCEKPSSPQTSNDTPADERVSFEPVPLIPEFDDSPPMLWAYVDVTAVAPTMRDSRRQLLFALFPSGRMIWSEDLMHGGPPYRHASLDGARVRSIIKALDERDERSSEYHLGPDMSYAVFGYRRSTGERIEFSSWHELYERNPNVVVTDKGVQPLSGGQSREAALAGASQAYLQFRQRWDELRDLMVNELPANAQSLDEPPEIEWK